MGVGGVLYVKVAASWTCSQATLVTCQTSWHLGRQAGQPPSPGCRGRCACLRSGHFCLAGAHGRLLVPATVGSGLSVPPGRSSTRCLRTVCPGRHFQILPATHPCGGRLFGPERSAEEGWGLNTFWYPFPRSAPHARLLSSRMWVQLRTWPVWGARVHASKPSSLTPGGHFSLERSRKESGPASRCM